MTGGLQLDLLGGPPVPIEELAPRVEAETLPSEPEPADSGDGTIGAVPEGQTTLFDLLEPWKEEWRGMPEFSMADQTPSRSLIVHFETVGDVLAFERAIGQTVGERLKSIWYPEAEITRYADKRYASE